MPRPRTVHLVDGSGQFHRAFHAIRGLATSRGLPTNATYGFTTMLRKLLQDEQPEHAVVLFDPPGRTFRHEQYAEYKANRPAMESDLAVQLPYIRRVCEAFRLPIVEVPGFEADDVIATLADQAVAAGFRVVVVTADKDMLQLVSDVVVILNPGREGTGATLLDGKAVEAKWGVSPERIVDVLALVGDSVDNVPGVPGIGDKGARDLVCEFGPVENVIANADKVKRAAYREGLKAHAQDALLSKQLVTLRRDVPVSLDLDAIVRRDPDRAACHALFKELEFQALAKEYAPEKAAGGRRPPRRPRPPVARGGRRGGARRGPRGDRCRRDGRAGDARAAPRRLALVGGGPVRVRSSRPRRVRRAGRAACRRGARRAAAGARGRVRPQGLGAQQARHRRPRPRRGRRSRAPASTRSSSRTSSTPAGARTRSRTSPSSTSASGGRRRATASRPKTLRRAPSPPSRAPRPSSSCGSTRP